MARDRRVRGFSSKSSVVEDVASNIGLGDGSDICGESESIRLFLFDVSLARSSSLSEGFDRFRDIGEMGAMLKVKGSKSNSGCGRRQRLLGRSNYYNPSS